MDAMVGQIDTLLGLELRLFLDGRFGVQSGWIVPDILLVIFKQLFLHLFDTLELILRFFMQPGSILNV